MLSSKQVCHLKLAFKVRLSSRENNSFSVFYDLLSILTNLFSVKFNVHILFVTAISKIPFLLKEIFGE